MTFHNPGTVDQPQPKRLVDLLDLSLPESDAVRHSIPVPRSGKQFQEEVGILFIEGSQPLGDDLDRSLVGVGLPGSRWGWSGFQGRSWWGGNRNRRSGRRDRATCGLEE